MKHKKTNNQIKFRYLKIKNYFIILVSLFLISLAGAITSPIYARLSSGNETSIKTSHPIDLGTFLKLSNDTPIKDVYNNPAFLVNLIVRNLFIVGGFIVFALIIIAGFKFIVGGKKGLEDAKNIATWGLIGFVTMFGAYWIVQIIKLITGADIIL